MDGIPLISVVMPLLNASAHLPSSMRSLAAQHQRRFEVVLVDGGSSDGSLALASDLLQAAAIPHRAELLLQSGIYEAMNHGVAIARGDWIYVMGADDQLAGEDVFVELAPILAHAAAEVLVIHGDVWIEDPGYRYGQSWDLPRFMQRNLSHQSAFYRRCSVQGLGVTYDPRYRLYADWNYNLRLFSLGRFLYVPLLVASYACTGASSQRVDEVFLREKEANALRYFGWRACWLLPPYWFAVGCQGRSSPMLVVKQFLNRLIWLLFRLRPLRQDAACVASGQ
ncbi:MAG: glycosyltransferase [Cyanobium sp.]